MDSLTINHTYFDSDTIVSHKSTMECLSKGYYTWSSVVMNDLVQLQKYCESFIFPLNQNTQRTETGVQDIVT